MRRDNKKEISMEKMLTSAPHSDQKWRCCYYSRFVTEKGALQDVQLDDLVSCLYTALDSAVVVCDEYQSRAEAASLEELDYCEAV